jgi:hypothetical protein
MANQWQVYDPLASIQRGWTVVYGCLDDYPGISAATEKILEPGKIITIGEKDEKTNRNRKLENE